MIEPFWDVLRRLSNNEKDAPESVEPSSHQKNSDASFLAALPVVRKIVRRRIVSLAPSEAADLEQVIVLRLLKWREKYPNLSEEMSSGDWESFAARTAYNETKRHFSKSADAKMLLPLDAAFDLESPERIIGESDAEFQSLTNFFWQEICRMTIKQKCALLLHSRKLIIYLLTGGVSDGELAQSLEISEEEWLEVKNKIPLSDAAIVRLNNDAGEHSNLESAIKSITKARHKARGKLRKLTNK